MEFIEANDYGDRFHDCRLYMDDRMESTTDVEEFANALGSLSFGSLQPAGGGWVYSYDSTPLVRSDGLRRVWVEFILLEDYLKFEKVVDGQQRQYQQPNEDHTDFDLDLFGPVEPGEVEFRHRIEEQGLTKFEFEIVIDGKPYYNFFHEER